MTMRIAIWLPDDLVDYIDQVVERGQASSRAAVVARAVERERRREVAAHDAAILAQAESDTDLTALAKLAARARFEDLA